MESELLQVQVGLESVWGTPVTPTAKLMGVNKFTLKPIAKTELRKYLRGSMAPGYTALVTEVALNGSFEEEPTYQDLPLWLDSIFGAATPGAGPGYARAYTAPLTTKPTPRLNTFVYGNAVDGVYKGTSVLIPKLVIKGNKQGVWTLTADLIGYDVTTGTLAALSDRTVNPIMGNQTVLYLDTWAGTIGTTAIAATAYDFELTIDSKMALKRHMTLRPDSYIQPAWDVSLKLSLEFNATSKAYLDAILAVTPGAPFQRMVRIKATDSSRIAQFDFAGSAGDPPDIFTDTDGVSSVDLVLQGTYNPTLTNYLLASVTNQVSVNP